MITLEFKILSNTAGIKMKTKTKIIFGLLVWLVSTGPIHAEVDLTTLVDKIRPAVATIVVYNVNRQVTGIGSGFFIDKSGHLITNHHVLAGSYAADVRTFDGKTYPIKLVVADDKSVDLIKVLVDIPRKKIKSIKLSKNLPSIAEQILVIGSPMGLEHTVSEGIVSSIREIPAVGKFFQMSAPISPGSSGSPVINLKGQVIGVATFQLVSGQNLNFAVAGESVLKLKATGPALSISRWTFNNSLEQPKLAEELCRQGYSFSINGEDQKAIQFFRQAIEKDPKNTMAWNGLGYCHVGLNNPQAAIKAYQQAIKTDPTDAALHFNLANYYIKLGRQQEAIDSYQQVISLNPSSEPAYFRLGVIYTQLDRLAEGKAAFEKVIRLNPNAAPAFFNIGIAYAKLGRYHEAINANKEVLRIKPDFAPAYNNMGLVYGKLGQPNDEVKAYKEAIRVEPDNVSAHFNLGTALLQRGDKTGALDEYKILKKLNKEAADNLFNKMYY
jgi:tetratricopeptide (TPR) repeat protein